MKAHEIIFTTVQRKKKTAASAGQRVKRTWKKPVLVRKEQQTGNKPLSYAQQKKNFDANFDLYS